MKKLLIVVSIVVLTLVASASALAANKTAAAKPASNFAAGISYSMGDSGLGFVFDYSGENMWNLPLTLRGFYHSGSSNANYTGTNIPYTNSVLGIADLYEFRNMGNNLTPYIGIGYQFNNISATVPGVGTATANGATLFYTIGAKYAVNSNISVDIAYSNVGQASIGSINGIAINPAFDTNAGGITLGALYSF